VGGREPQQAPDHPALRPHGERDRPTGAYDAEELGDPIASAQAEHRSQARQHAVEGVDLQIVALMRDL